MLSIKKLKSYVSKSKLRYATHPLHELYIWNYTETIHYEKKWDAITRICRGLVTDFDGNIIARSFPKFFNFEENEHRYTDNYRVFDKLDGSLGILFYYDGEWVFASRGSFVSEQAVEGMKILKEKFPQYECLNCRRSYVFEIIYPLNRIVLNYDDKRTLIFLSSFDVDGPEYLDIEPMRELGFEVVEEFATSKTLEELKNLNLKNKEGFVIRYDSGERVKVKFEDYINLHRIVSNLNVKSVFKFCKDGKPLEEILMDIPDEFNEWFRAVYDGIMSKYNEMIAESTELFEKHRTKDREEFELSVNNEKYAKILFCFYNNKQVDVIRNTAFNMINLNSLPFSDRGLSITKLPEKSARMIFLVGRSGSGKSTWANRFRRNRKDVIIVNRDNIRIGLFGFFDDRDVSDYYRSSDINGLEKVVTKTSEDIIGRSLADSKTIIIDNTNLNKVYIKQILALAFPNTEITYKVFGENATQSELLSRTQTRTFNKMTKAIIEKQTMKFKGILRELDDIFKKTEPLEHLIQNPDLPKAVIFDIDGTLALNNSGRNDYDMSRVSEDDPNLPIVELCKRLHTTGLRIVVCTGRTDDCREQTVCWLNKYQIPFDTLYMRPFKNNEKDFYIKEKMWKSIISENYVVSMFDDRNQVVEHARTRGFTVCQVADGNF